MKPLTTKEFILKAKLIHGNKYDYRKVVYINNYTKVIIICPIHGEFEQSPASHLQGSDCSKCNFEKLSITLSSNTREFITKAIKVHGVKYNYSKTIYISARGKVTIICPIHGEFEQTAANHLQGSCCPKCIMDNRKYTTEEFIRRARLIHGDRYDYSKTIYINSITNVIIICPIHGEFDQTPANHLSGSTCNICCYEKIGNLKRSNLEEFIKKAIAVHDNKYSYPNAIYIDARTMITITCKKHKDFEQLPSSHLRGHGCPGCTESKGELVISKILTKNNVKYVREYRIPEIDNRLHYDFYLPDYNTLIEFHGVQHYEYVPYFHRNGEDDLLIQKNRDDVIRNNARQFKYRYLEFNDKHLKFMPKKQFEEFVMKKLKTVKDTEAESSKANAEQFNPHLPKPIVDTNSFQKVEPSVSQ